MTSCWGASHVVLKPQVSIERMINIFFVHIENYHCARWPTTIVNSGVGFRRLRTVNFRWVYG